MERAHIESDSYRKSYDKLEYERDGHVLFDVAMIS